MIFTGRNHEKYSILSAIKYIFVPFAYKYSRKQTQFDQSDTVSLIYPFLNVYPGLRLQARVIKRAVCYFHITYRNYNQ